MKKLFLSFLTVLLPMMAFADAVEIDGIYYNLVPESKEAEVTSKPENYYSGSVVIPSSIPYEGVEYSVTSIGNDAFRGCGSLTSVSIPNSVTSIKWSAFSLCGNLVSVNISDIEAFCSIMFYSGDSNPLKNGGNLYLNGEVITDLLIPNGVKTIGKYAFNGCSSLSTVTIPNSVTSIGGYAFSYCRNLSSIIIPNSVTSIESSVFRECSNLSSITIPDGVTSIGENAFKTCTNLTSITIPNSLISIGKNAFYDCVNLTSITIPNSVTSIGESAFGFCRSLTTITIPNTLTSIESSVFEECGNLSSVTIPNSVTSIGNNAFCACFSLASVTIPNSVTFIGWGSFYYCINLTSVTIGSSVDLIHESAFSSCKALTDVYCFADNVPSTDDYVFTYSPIDKATLHVPASAIEAYKAAEPWKNFKDIVPLDGTSVETLEYTSPSGRIDIYSIDGKLIGSAADQSEAASVVNHLPSGTTAIVRMEGKSVKVVVK